MIKKNCPITGGHVIISDSNKIYQLNCNDIEIISSKDNVSIIQSTKRKPIVIPQNLTYIEKQFCQCRFIRINRNELINCNKISSIDCKTREVSMESGEKLTISVRNMVKIREKLCIK